MKNLYLILFILLALVGCSRNHDSAVPNDAPTPPSAIVDTSGVIPPPVTEDTTGPPPPPEPLTAEEEAQAIVIDMESYALEGIVWPRPATHEAVALKVIAERKGICGERSHAMLYLLEQKSIPCRYVGIWGISAFGVPCHATHATVEVYYDRAWHWYDPTYGVWFTNDDGVVMSLAQLIDAAYNGDLMEKGRGTHLSDLIGFFQSHGAITYGYEELSWMGRFWTR